MTDADSAASAHPHPAGPDPLDRVLAAALRRPELPDGFHAALMEQIDLEQAVGLETRRLALAREHERQLEDLRRGYLRMRQDTLLTVVAGAFTCGAAVAVGLPALAQWTGMDMAALAIWIAGGLALAAGVAAVRQKTRLLG